MSGRDDEASLGFSQVGGAGGFEDADERDAELDGFHQPTAMFDKGQFLGELADLVDGSPDTRAAVEAEPSPPKGCRLIVVAGPDLGSAWAFKDDAITIGRDDDCTLPLADIAVSRQHARITLHGASFRVEDLGSNNGTYLNGDRLAGPTELVAGDEIIVGERTLRFVELNEAPETSAGLPAVDAAPTPEVFAGAGMSQIDAEAVVRPVSLAEAPPRGRALRRMLLIVGGVVGLVAVVVGGGVGWWQWEASKVAAARAAEARTRFLQVVELVKLERFGDARRLLDRLEILDPEHPRAADYRRHVDAELVQWGVLERAAAASTRSLEEAIEILATVQPDSAYADEAVRRSRVYERRMARRDLARARAELEAGRFDAALALVAKALDRDPGSREARLLMEEIEGRRAGAAPAPARKKAFTIPPVLVRAVMLYRDEKLAAAVDAAEAAGTDFAREAAGRMKTMQRYLADGELAHRKKAGAELLALVPKAIF